MKVLLTGKTGFIGRHLEKYFSKLSDVSELHCTVRRQADANGIFDHVLDLTDKYAVKTMLHEVQPDVILHFAANPTTKLDHDNPTLITTNNIVSTQNLLHYAPAGCRFIFASTILVYGETPIFANEKIAPNPTSVYGASKLACEGLVSAYTNMGLVKGVSLRLSATIGKNLSHGILYDFMKKVYSDSREFEILGNSPGSSKPFTHVKDVCRVTKHFMRNEKIGAYNVCPMDNISALEIAEIVMGTTNKIKPIKFLGSDSLWIGDNNLLKIDNTKLLNSGLYLKYPTSTIAIASVVREIYESNKH